MNKKRITLYDVFIKFQLLAIILIIIDLLSKFICVKTLPDFVKTGEKVEVIKDFFYLPTFLKDYLFFIEMNLDAIIEQDTLSVKQETITEKKTEEIISCMDELAIRIGNNSREFKDLATLEEKEAYLKELKTLITRLKLNKLKEVEQEEASEILAVEEPDYEEDYQPNFVNILKRTAASANVIVFATTLVILFIFVMFAILLQLIF